MPGLTSSELIVEKRGRFAAHLPAVQAAGLNGERIVVAYLQVGNFEEVFRGVAKISRHVHQAVKHMNLVALKVVKTKTQTPNYSAAEVRFAPSDGALKLVFPPELSFDASRCAISRETEQCGASSRHLCAVTLAGSGRREDFALSGSLYSEHPPRPPKTQSSNSNGFVLA